MRWACSTSKRVRSISSLSCALRWMTCRSASRRLDRPAAARPSRPIALKCLQPSLAGLVFLLLQRLALDLKLHGFALDLVQLGRIAGDLHSQPAGGLVDQVDGLVGQEAVRNITVRQRGRGDDRRIGDPHVMMDLVAFLETLRHVPAHDAHANPSAMAVLPTPGSPISTGLFLVRG